ncbi:sensor histidine kinase [Leucobacter sp. HY1910]
MVAALLAATTVLSSILLLTLGRNVLNPPAQVAAAFGISAIMLVLCAIVTRYAPGDITAPLLAAQGLAVTVTNSAEIDPAGVLGGTWMLLYLPLALVLVVTPSGHPASSRWRAVAWALCAIVAVFIGGVAIAALVPLPAAIQNIAALILLLAFLVVLVACAVAPFARYRYADERDRLRLRWVLVAGLSLPLTLLLCWASYIALGSPDLVVFGLAVMMIAIPVGATIAVTRPELFDIDRAIVAAVTVLVLIAAALAALTVVSSITGRPMDAWPPVGIAAATASATITVVITFPFARRGFDRMLYPERARAVARLHRLAAQVEAGTAVPEEVEGVLREALRDPGLVVVFRRGGDGALAGLDGAAVTPGETAMPVRAHGDEIGSIVPSATRIKRPAAAVARAAAPLVYAARSRVHLARANAEIAASRERLVRAGYEVRRRIERDLHDGTQQRLVAVGMHLRVLQRTSGHDPELTAALDAAVAELSTAVAELRQIAHGLRPSDLDDGLAAALAHLTRTEGTTVELDVRADHLPDAVATTAYYVVSESVANALRHAEASQVRVAVHDRQGTLRVRVADDGCGGATVRGVGGLTNLGDRVAALGGTWRMVSPVGGGTTIEAVLPCGL